jgi:hypothetical protein
VNVKTGLDDLEKRKFFTLTELRPLGRPAHSIRYTDCSIPAPISFLMAVPAHSERKRLIQFLNHFSQTVGRVISPSEGLYLNTEQYKYRTNAYTQNIYALSGIRTHDPSLRASEDS